jgi:hypothetical protein
MGGKKRHKQHPHWVTAAANYDSGNDEKAGCSSVGRVMIVVRSGERQAQPPIDHFKNLLEEACPNHAYTIEHKLRDYDMMKNFMVSGSLTQGMELNEVPREAAVMMVHGGHPTRSGWGH